LTGVPLPDSKRAHERQVFDQFCAAIGFSLVPGSIQQLDPPAPDLLATFDAIGEVAFELVRLNHEDQLTRLSLMERTPSFLDDAFAKLETAHHAALSATYADGIITIDFRGAVHLGGRRKALPFLWRMLESMPAGFQGQIDLWGLGAPDAIRSIWVSRGETGGRPWFKTGTAGFVLPLDSERITKKLTRALPYKCNAPLELLAYVHQGELAHLNAGDEICAAVIPYLDQSQFRRVCVFEGLRKRVAMTFTRTD